MADETILQQTEDTSPTADDFVPVWDVSSATTKKVTIANIGGGAWRTWTGSYSNISVGNGTVISKYSQIGKTVNWKFKLTFGTTTAFNASQPIINLPVTSITGYDSASSQIGNGRAWDVSASTAVPIFALWQTTTTQAPLGLDAANATYNLSSSAPFAWTTGDILYLQGMYEAA